MSTPYIGLVKAEYDYAATNEEELDINEDQLLYVLEDDDADWWKVRTKQSPSAGTSASEAPAGLVPASYVTPVAPVKQVTAMYDYTATAEEEISISEDATYDFYEDDGEWALVGSKSSKQVGYAPSTYFDLEGGGSSANGGAAAAPAAAAIPAPPPPPPAPPAPAAPPAPVAAAGGGFKLPPPPRRMGGDSSDDSDDDESEPPRSAPVAPAAAFIPPPPPPPPPAPPAPAFASPPPAAPAAPRPPAVVAPVPVAASGKKAVAAYDFTAAGTDEISMVEGETVYVIDDSQDDWWKIRNERGEEGEVPATYVELEEGGASASAVASASADDDEAYARKAAEEEKEERRKDRERKRLRALEDEARGFSLPAMQPPPRRKDSPATAISPAPRSAVSPPPPAPIPVPPPAPEAGVRSPSPPPMSPAMRDAADKQRDGRGERDERRERHRQREREREKQRERERDYDRDRNGHSPPVEKTKPSRERTRIWKDKTGAFKVEAEFVGLSGPNNDKIRLHKTNGVVIEVPVDKMSPDDLKLLEHMTRRRLGPRRDDDRDRRRDRGDDRRDRGDDRRDRDRGDERRSDRDRGSDRERDDRGKARPPSETVRDRSKAAPGGKKSQTDWFEWFLNAGCDVDDCSRYANNFEKDRIDESILPDLESGTLRSLGLREGDIIRVSKHIKNKYGSTAAGPGASASKSSEAPQPPRKEVRQEKEDQMDDDEELARKLQEELNAGRDGSGLFTTKEGGVKNTRRGRPTPKSSTGIERTSTPDPVRLSPDTTREASNRSSSTQPVASGFDDDAWTVKPASKPATPALVDVSPTPAMPASSNQASNAQALTDAYLESMGLGKNSRPPVTAAPARQAAASPAPAPQLPQQQQQQQQYAQDNQLAPQQTGYYAQPSVPRAPPIPIPINQQLLNPLVPTQTGLTGYIPTRNQASPMQGMMPQQTGFVPQPTGFQPQAAMYQPQPQASMFQPQPTGFQPQQIGFQPQPTGFQPQQTGFQPQQTGFQAAPSMLAPQQQFGGGMMPQQTGYPTNQMAQMSIQPTGSPSMFNQPQQQAPQQMQGPASSTSSTEYQPSNIFAAMKAGQFAKPADQQPQQEQKYDSLRPQPTGFAAGGQMGGMQPIQAQPTGFAPFGGYMQQQPPPMMYGQQTGYPYRQY